MMPLNSTSPLASAEHSALGLSGQSPRPAAAQADTQAEQRAQAGEPGPVGPQAPSGDQPSQGGKLKSGLPLRKRPQEVRRIAIELFPASESWVVFYRELLGVDGVVRKLFTTVEEVRFWEASEEFLEIQEMLTALRSSDSGKGDSAEPQRMITVRLPTSLHESLKVEADEHQTSMNKLCTSKLLMSIAERFVPVESGRIRGRKPGPQGKRKAAAEQPAGQSR